MRHIFLSLGSNLGNRSNNLEKARKLLAAEAGLIVAESAVYETEPWGHRSESTFFNQILELDTALDPPELLKTVQHIEIRCGRRRSDVKFEARTVDIDILFFNDVQLDSDNLVIPHPLLHLRRFVLMPLADIAPLFIHPVLGTTVKELLDSCEDNHRILQQLQG
jgi:2-amino-4-hydroxy-6-hydroxymethyldihydropteridine diphosphokinase